LEDKLKSQLKNTLVRNTLWMSAGQGLRLVIQAVFFTVIARSLGVGQYGSFIGVAALVGILYPFAALGGGNLLIKSVAREKQSFSIAWGEALLTVAICGTGLVAVVLVLAHFVLPAIIPIRLVFSVAVADILGLCLTTIAGQAFQAFEQLHWMAAINVLLSASRLAGAIGLIVLHHHPTALQWGYVYLGCTAFTAAASSGLVCVRLGAPRFAHGRSLTSLREGVYFSISLGAQTVYNDIDKTMLARLGSLDATGIYGAAYRLIDVSFAPVTALLSAAYPNFFREGSAGVSSSLRYARPLLKRALGYSVFISCGILLFAGIVPYVLGSEYARTAEALRWLSPLPVLKAMHYFLSDTLTGAGHQGLRSGIQTGVALFNFVINLWLIPRYSWRGAAWSSIASDALLAFAVAMAVRALSKRPVSLVASAV
jgi:O-antigen/teichoic acid export membrane protein